MFTVPRSAQRAPLRLATLALAVAFAALPACHEPESTAAAPTSTKPAAPTATKPAATTAARPAAPQPPDDGVLVQRVDALARAALSDHHLPGLSIAIARGGRVVMAKGYGVADLAHHRSATADTVYRIGSMTKQFTAAAIMQLVQQGKVHLEDPITAYLPGYPTHGQRITIENLLTHTSGIADYTALPNWRALSNTPMPRAQLVKRFAERPLAFAPGTRFAYSNSNYYLLGLVIEKVTGKPYATVVHDRLLAPAGMKASGYCSDDRPGQAVGYSLHEDGGPTRSAPLVMAHPFAAGALCATAPDLLRWQHALDHGEVVSARSHARMITPERLKNGHPTGYGFGLFIGDLDGHRVIGHGGGINGFVSQLSHYPDDHLTVVVLVNAETSEASALEQRVARAALGLPEPTIADLATSKEQRALYAGRYQLMKGVTVRVFEDKGRLEAQATGQPVSELLYQGEDTFVLKADPTVRLVFALEHGHASAFTLHQGGMTLEASRVPGS